MTHPLRIALASAGGFVLGYFLPTIAFLIVYFAGRTVASESRASPADDSLMVIYLAGVYAFASAIVFAAITSTSRHWRMRSARRVAGIGAIAGALAQLLSWTGLSLVVLLPLTHVLPRALTTVAGVAAPGMLTGIAVLIWAALRPAPPIADEAAADAIQK